jgi:hypothetical protein
MSQTSRSTPMKYDRKARVWVTTPCPAPVAVETSRAGGQIGFDHMAPDQARQMALALLAAAMEAEDRA